MKENSRLITVAAIAVAVETLLVYKFLLLGFLLSIMATPCPVTADCISPYIVSDPLSAIAMFVEVLAVSSVAFMAYRLTKNKFLLITIILYVLILVFTPSL